MTKNYCYALVGKKGKMILVNHQLPLIWNKKVAEEEAKKFKAFVVRLNTNDIQNMIYEQIPVKHQP